MYDRRERSIRDRKWELADAEREGQDEGRIEGEIKGEIKMIRMLQGLLGMTISDETELSAMGLEQLDALTSGLQEKLRSRAPRSPPSPPKPRRCHSGGVGIHGLAARDGTQLVLRGASIQAHGQYCQLGSRRLQDFLPRGLRLDASSQ